MSTKRVLDSCCNWFRFWLASTVDRRARPKILLLADRRGGAFDNCAQQMRTHLREEFIIDIRYVREKPRLSAAKYDLVYIYFWGETYHRSFNFDPNRTIKEVSSHRWEDDPQYGPCAPLEMVRRYLIDADSIICTSQRLYELVRPDHPRVFLASNGFDPLRFRLQRLRTGPMIIGWAGNINDSVKGVCDILQPACSGRFSLLIADGGLSHVEMNDFYNKLDICAITSSHEGSPLTLLESMAAGCFPVCTNVGVVPEVIRDGENGLIVKERTPSAFRAAFEWCEANIENIRNTGKANAELICHDRSWEKCMPLFRAALVDTLRHASRPRFRNDDVSPDIPLHHFRRFCEIFWKYGYDQVHGITLRGRTHGLFRFGSDEAQYDGIESISKIPNFRIRELSEPVRFEDRGDLINYLRDSPDEIALHGLYHTDYSAMSEKEQLQEMTMGLEILCELFPAKRVRYFIAPFNRTNEHTYYVAQQLGLKVLAAEGVHLEAQLPTLRIQPGTWYRYHHHRFYPESTYRYSDLSLELLDKALSKKCETLAEDLPMRRTKG